MSKKPLKVYLSRSKASCPQETARLTKLLKTLDITLLDHPGEDAKDKVRQCDQILVLPPLRYSDSGTYTVGFGQYNLIEHFLRTHTNKDVWIVNTVEDNRIYIDELMDMMILDNDWKTQYAEVYTNDACIDITNYGIKPIDDRYGNEELMEEFYLPYEAQLARTVDEFLNRPALPQDRPRPMLCTRKILTAGKTAMIR